MQKTNEIITLGLPVVFKFDVRLHNEKENVDAMLSVLLNGGTLPPIIVNQKHDGVEGRQRSMAAEMAGFKEIKAEVIYFNDEIEERVFALNQQLGCAAPVTEEDIRWNMRQFIISGMSRNQAVEAFPRLPKKLVELYYDNAHSTINAQNLLHAVDAIFDGKQPIDVVCKKFNVTKDQLNAAKSRKKRNVKNAVVLNTKATFGNSMRSPSLKVENAYKALIFSIKDGQTSPKDAVALSKHYFEKVQNIYLRAQDYHKRITQMGK